MFTDATEQAVANADKDLTPSPEQSDTQGNETSPTPEPKAEGQTPQDILDLAKLGKFKVDGEEMTYEDLKRDRLRQQDYTKKTQALAEERKFIDNLSVDLDAVKKNPRLAEQFKQIYPEKFHAYLAFVMDQQAKAEGTQPPDAKPNLPPEILERLERSEQMAQRVVSEIEEQTKESLNSMFTNVESDVQKKFPRADMVHVYGAVSDYLEANNVTSKQLLKDKATTVKMFEQYAKASHEANLKQYEAWKKEELEKVKAANSKAQDIGAGGGTPSGAPKSYAGKGMFGRVADDMIADLKQT